MHRRLASVVAVVTVLVAVVGCSSSGGGPSPSTSASSVPVKGLASGTLSADSAPSTSPTSASPSLTPPSATRTSTPPPGLRDFSTVSFGIPGGFKQVADYSPQVPLESDYDSYYLVPTNVPEGQEVIGIYVYTFPATTTVTAKTDQVALIKAYNTKSKATAPSIKPASSDIDGLPAYTESVTEPPNYHYVAYWAFGTHHFLQFTCQVGASSAVPALVLACTQALLSIELN